MNHDRFINDFINKKTIKFIPSPSSVNFKKIPRRAWTKAFPSIPEYYSRSTREEKFSAPFYFLFEISKSLAALGSKLGHKFFVGRTSSKFQFFSPTSKKFLDDETTFLRRVPSARNIFLLFFCSKKRKKKRALIKTGRDCLRDVT